MKNKTVFGALFGLITGIGTGIAVSKKIIFKPDLGEDMKTGKFRKYYYLLNDWLRLKQDGKTLEEYFLGNGYQYIAIYGMGEVGNRLYNELKCSNIDIRYAIDKNGGLADDNLEIRDIDDNFDDIDVIVVTATFAFDEIANTLKGKATCPVISLEDVIYGLE